MRWWNDPLVKLKLRKPAPQITRQQALAIKPIHNPNLEWEYNEEDRVVATLTRRGALLGKLVTFFLTVPKSRPVVLDEVGSFVWRMCDGQHSVADIVEALSEKYNLTTREVEVSLNEYLRMLGKRGMILVAVPKDIVAQLDEQTKQTLGVTELEEIAGTEQSQDRQSEAASDELPKPSDHD